MSADDGFPWTYEQIQQRIAQGLAIARANASLPKQWDYRVRLVDTIDVPDLVGCHIVEDKLNEAADGWELVSVTKGRKDHDQLLCIFKRPK